MIREVFDCEVYESYGAREGLMIAAKGDEDYIFQIVNLGEDSIVLKYVLAKSFIQDVLDRVVFELREKMKGALNIQLMAVQEISSSPSG